MSVKQFKKEDIKILDKIELNDYKNLIKNASWKILSDEQHLGSLQNSMYISAIEVNNKVVGLARLVGDNSVHGLLCDVVVLDDYQNNGFGTILVNNIMEKVKNSLKYEEQFLIELCPSYGKRNFYLKCGFKYKPENMDGMYLWIKKEK
ncbi:MAG: GNAT family N-acetyltransferase [Mycoplasmatota bacterium]